MDQVMYLKFIQHDNLRTLLLNTYPAKLVYVDPHDRFWGVDRAGIGRNKFGKSLMGVREVLRCHDLGLWPTMPRPDWSAGARIKHVIEFDGYGEYSGLLCHSSHSVVYGEDLYPTALHLFEARKFIDHRPDLADQIRLCENVEEIPAISAELAEFMRRDWSNIALDTVSSHFHPHFVLRMCWLYLY